MERDRDRHIGDEETDIRLGRIGLANLVSAEVENEERKRAADGHRDLDDDVLKGEEVRGLVRPGLHGVVIDDIAEHGGRQDDDHDHPCQPGGRVAVGSKDCPDQYGDFGQSEED